MSVYQLLKIPRRNTRPNLLSGEWLTHEFNIIDTGGIEIEMHLSKHKYAQAEIAIDEADVIILW